MSNAHPCPIALPPPCRLLAERPYDAEASTPEPTHHTLRLQMEPFVSLAKVEHMLSLALILPRHGVAGGVMLQVVDALLEPGYVA